MHASPHKVVSRAPSPTVQRARVPAPAARVSIAPEGPSRLRPRAAGTLRVSSPSDPAEREAERVASHVLGIPDAPAAAATATAHRSPHVARLAAGIVQRPGIVIGRKAEGMPDVSANVSAEIAASRASGSPLPPSVRRFMEPRFAASFENIRVHQDDRAARLSRKLNARAFTFGDQIFFARGQFRPETSDGRALIAHELTHTIQQGAVAQRGDDSAVRERSAPEVQRLGVSDALDFFADKANLIPGFRMFTILLGLNPINMSRVERSPANLLRAVVEFLPGGGLIVLALDRLGIFDRIGAWISQRLETLGITGRMIREALDRFLDSLDLSDILRLGSVWERAKRIFSEPIDRILVFARSLASAILQFIRDAILRPIAALAENTRGYDLLRAILGQDPITGDPYPRNAETLIGGFMKLIGQEEVWQNLKRANAVSRAWTWFQGALAGLLGFVRTIPQRFVETLRSLTIEDLVLLPRAFARVAGFFIEAGVQFGSWALRQVLSLLQIIFDVLAPGAMVYLRRAAGAFQTIVRNPIGFLGNLVRAGIQGFRQFAGNFLNHLKASLVAWLTGTLAGSAIHIPQAFTPSEILKFVLSVLGLTWTNLRTRLVRIIGETAVGVLESGFDLVKTLVTQGPAAAWQQILEGISNLKEMVIDQIMTFVRDRVVQAAITKLVTSLNPAGAFIQAVIAIYNTVMFFVERLKQIAQVAMAFIDSIAAIASGVIGAAANRVETTMAGLLTLVISFLARIAGLGRVSDAVTGLLERVRAPIFRAMDRVADWIIARARAMGRLLSGGARAGAVGAAAGPAAAPAADRVTQTITLNGVSHALEGVSDGRRIQLFMQSRREPLIDKLTREANQWSGSVDPEISRNGRSLAGRVAGIRRKETEFADQYLRITDNAARHAAAVAGVGEIARLLMEIAAEYGITVEDDDIPRATPYHASGLNRGRATRAYADPLTIESLRPRQASAQFAPGGFLSFPGRNRYAAGHLLADTLGGPNEPANLALVSRATNGRFSSVESRVRNALRGTRKIPPRVAVLRYEVACGFQANGPAELEAWVQQRLAASFPSARFSGVGERIFKMMEGQRWSVDVVAAHLGVDRRALIDHDDAIKARAAMLYLPSSFTIGVSVRAGRGINVSGESFPNHL